MARPPNVIVILTDQHRGDLLSCAGNGEVPTPQLDRLAARGVRFTNVYCAYPVCVASRSAMLTGLYAHTTGAIANEDRLDWRYRTIAHHFAAQGYLTALIGKMHFNDANKHGFAYHLSINDWLMYLGPKAGLYANEIASHPLGPRFFETMRDDGAGFPDVADLWDGPSPWVGRVTRSDFASMASGLAAEDHLDAFVAREAERFLRRYRDQPFLLVAGFMKPHTPLFAPPEWAERYPVDQMPLPPAGDPRSYPPHVSKAIAFFEKIPARFRQAHRAGYAANLAFVDHCIGRVCGVLDALNLWRNTIVVYTSDHGEMHGDHGLYQKFCLFDPAVKVPLFISQAGRLPAGRVCDALVEQFGLYPTLAELAGLGPPSAAPLADLPGAPAQLDAVSFARLAENPAAAGPAFAYSENNLRGTPAQYMIRDSRYKYIHNRGSLDELYDLAEDPGEFKNLAQDPARRETISRLQRELLAWHDPAASD